MTQSAAPDAWLRQISGACFSTPPKHLAVAVSGGGDSMACLDLMLWHGRKLGVPVSAVTLDHGLRAEAKEEIAFVAETCARIGVEHSVLTWSWDRTGNLQAEARAARYGLISEWAVARGIDCVATGHTKDDVAETFLMRLARQASVDGLSEMERRFEHGGTVWVRPLLDVPRAVLRDYLSGRGLSWQEDPSNEDPAFDRVRARKALEGLKPLGLDVEALASVARTMSSARDALRNYAAVEARTHVAEQSGDLILPARGGDTGMPDEVMFRLRRLALQWVGGEPYPARRTAIEAMEAALQNGAAHTLAGCRISPEGKNWRVSREFNAVRETKSTPDRLWDGRWRMSGPDDTDVFVAALGEAVRDTPWRGLGLPRASLEASPAIWRGNRLIAAPLAGIDEGWLAENVGRGKFSDFVHSR